MPEQRFEVRNVGIDYICDTCGKGKMFPHGNAMLMSNPPQFPHKCDNCEATKNLRERYPTFRVERVEQI